MLSAAHTDRCWPAASVATVGAGAAVPGVGPADTVIDALADRLDPGLTRQANWSEAAARPAPRP